MDESESAATRDSALRKRSVTIAGHATSVSLEDIFWHHLRRIAEERDRSLASLIAEVDRDRPGNLSSALRLLVVTDLERRAGTPTGVSCSSTPTGVSCS